MRVGDAAQTESSARVLPCLTLTVPMESKLRQLLPQLRRGCLAERHPNPPADNLGEIIQAGIAGFQKLQNFGDRQVRFFFRASASIGKRLSFFSGCATGAVCAVVVVLLLLNCADLLPSPDFFCVFVFMVFFFCSAVRLLSVALHEKSGAVGPPPWE